MAEPRKAFILRAKVQAKDSDKVRKKKLSLKRARAQLKKQTFRVENFPSASELRELKLAKARVEREEKALRAEMKRSATRGGRSLSGVGGGGGFGNILQFDKATGRFRRAKLLK